MTQQKDYPYIRAWCKMMGSYNYFTEGQIAQATRDGAPDNACYFNSHGHWVTFDEVKSEGVRARIRDILKQEET